MLIIRLGEGPSPKPNPNPNLNPGMLIGRQCEGHGGAQERVGTVLASHVMSRHGVSIDSHHMAEHCYVVPCGQTRGAPECDSLLLRCVVQMDAAKESLRSEEVPTSPLPVVPLPAVPLPAVPLPVAGPWCDAPEWHAVPLAPPTIGWSSAALTSSPCASPVRPVPHQLALCHMP